MVYNKNMDLIKKNGLTILTILYSFVPSVALAVTTPTDFKSFVMLVVNIINLTIPVVGALVMLVFFWGLAKFIFNAGNDDKLEDGKKLMYWGVIAIFVMFSVWGLVSFLYSSIFSGSIGIPAIPADVSGGNKTSTYQLSN